MPETDGLVIQTFVWVWDAWTCSGKVEGFRSSKEVPMTQQKRFTKEFEDEAAGLALTIGRTGAIAHQRARDRRNESR